MLVESQRAEINTATIEIRTLVIDRRQVTMATFRQVPSVPHIVATDDLWGTVNYFPEKNGGDGKRHVLLVRDDHLARCVIRPRLDRPPGLHLADEDADFLAHCYLALPENDRPRTLPPISRGRWQFVINLPFNSDFGHMLAGLDGGRNYAYYRERLEAKVFPESFESEFFGWVDGHVAAWERDRAGWLRSEELPQLYIAT